METDNDIKEGLEFVWTIHNFNFCWHKTGECLKSPPFWINYSQTLWTLCLYPRGEDDGEHVSCYLFREDGGPDIVNVDFELSLYVVGKVLYLVKYISFSRIYSFKIFQREGLACFASRREVFASMGAQKERFSLAFVCKIFNVNEQKLDDILLFGHTTIETERISGTEVFDDPTDLQPENCKDVNLKPLSEKDPIIGINVSCYRKNLVIKIHPKSCHKIKYAVCKITLINEWTNGTRIEYVRCWIGEIRAHIWRYVVPYKETESAKLNFEFNPSKALILHYDFSFSTGEQVSLYSLRCPSEYMEIINFNMSKYLNKKVNTTKRIPTALDALKSLWTSRSFTDVNIPILNRSFLSHKALLSARSSTFKSHITEASETIHFSLTDTDIFSRILMFLYTDSVNYQSNDYKNSLNMKILIKLYKYASFFKVELLLTRCRVYFLDHLDIFSAHYVLLLADNIGDLSLKDNTESYIRAHFDLLHKTRFWQDLSKNCEKLAKEVCLSKYIKKKTIH